jgi:hypothetical protein
LDIVLDRCGGAVFECAHREPRADSPTSLRPDTRIYQFRVRTSNPETVKVMGSADEELRSVLASPESLRNYGLRVYAALALQIESDFLSGKALQDVKKLNDHQFPVPATMPPTPEERQRALEEARRWVRARLDAINTDYREMHAAVMKAFPLTDCLRPEKKP